MASQPLRVTAVTAAAQLGGTERVLLDFASRAFEFDVALSVLTPTDGPLVGILNEIGVPCEVVPAPASLLRASQRGANIWTLPRAVFGVWGWASRLKQHAFIRDADVLYTQGFKAHLAAAIVGKRPVVWHLHEFPPRVTGGFWKLLMRLRADAGIANSESVEAAWGRTDGRTVIPNGVDLDRFAPRSPTKWIHRQLGIPERHRLVGMPAVFARWKGQLEVIEAFGTIADEFPDVHLVLVGGSIYDTVAEREFGAQLTARSSHDRVHILPFQSKIELAYPEFDLVVHYSTRPEAFGRVIVEAMACGVPVIAAGEGGPIEIIGESGAGSGTVGWLAEPRDPTKLAGTLREVLTLPVARLLEIGAAGRRRAEDQFSSRRFARQVAEALRGALSSPP